VELRAQQEEAERRRRTEEMQRTAEERQRKAKVCGEYVLALICGHVFLSVHLVHIICSLTRIQAAADSIAALAAAKAADQVRLITGLSCPCSVCCSVHDADADTRAAI
jgi:hypothetical protein